MVVVRVGVKMEMGMRMNDEVRMMMGRVVDSWWALTVSANVS